MLYATNGYVHEMVQSLAGPWGCFGMVIPWHGPASERTLWSNLMRGLGVAALMQLTTDMAYTPVWCVFQMSPRWAMPLP